ncbi:MAG: hypothetical protein P8Y53_05740 [Pseudolabrys sp.]|jgi:hypothetical protein
MVGESITGLGFLKTAFDLAKALKDIDDAARRNAAVIELQEKILEAQSAQSALVERARELEAKVDSFEKWEAEGTRYQLKDFGGGTFAYELKADEARGEPMHHICPNCYEKGRKSILQMGGGNAFKQQIARCPACQTEFGLGVRQTQHIRRGPSWR